MLACGLCSRLGLSFLDATAYQIVPNLVAESLSRSRIIRDSKACGSYAQSECEPVHNLDADLYRVRSADSLYNHWLNSRRELQDGAPVTFRDQVQLPDQPTIARLNYN